MQNLRPSNVKVIFQRPSCGYPYSGGFGFHCRYCPCGRVCRSSRPASQFTAAVARTSLSICMVSPGSERALATVCDATRRRQTRSAATATTWRDLVTRASRQRVGRVTISKSLVRDISDSFGWIRQASSSLASVSSCRSCQLESPAQLHVGVTDDRVLRGSCSAEAQLSSAATD